MSEDRLRSWQVEWPCRKDAERNNREKVFLVSNNNTLQTQLTERVTRSTCPRGTKGHARIRTTTGYAGGCVFRKLIY